MPPRDLTWSKLVPGLIAIGVIAAGALAVLLFARVGSLRGSTYRLYVRADEARGVIKGTEVWLAGQKVGIVRGVAFRPVSSDTLGRLAVALDVLERYQPAIRRDSHVEFRAGGTPIGATIVSVGVGSPTAPLAQPGDTLPRAPQIDSDSVRNQLSIAVQQLPELLTDARAMSANLQQNLARTRTPAGDRPPSVTTLAERTQRLAEHVGEGRGTLPLLLHDAELGARAHRAAERGDSLLRLANEQGIPGRMRRDSTLFSALQNVRNEIAIVRARIAGEQGTAGRLVHDSALARQLRVLDANLGATIESFTRDPGRYISF